MSRIPDFTKVVLQDIAGRKAPERAAGPAWLTNEQIPVKRIYTAADTQDLEHTGFVAGLPP